MKNICRLPLLFLGLCLSSLAGAQTDTNLLVTTDMDCNWKLDGQPMDPLKAHASNVFPVSPGEHHIWATTADGVTKIRIEAEVDQSQKKVEIRLKDEHDRQLKMQESEAAVEPAEEEVVLNPTWTDPITGLMWTGKDNGADVDWNQADAYCSSLQLAGYGGWRLPTIGELEGIYDGSVKIRTGFDFGDALVRVKGNLRLTGWDWSSSEGKTSGFVQEFNFAALPEEKKPLAFARNFSYSMRALCVRRP